MVAANIVRCKWHQVMIEWDQFRPAIELRIRRASGQWKNYAERANKIIGTLSMTKPVGSALVMDGNHGITSSTDY